MNTFILSGLLTAAISCGAALACPPSEMGRHEMRGPGKLEPMVNPWQKLHDELKLSPEQEAAWNTMQEHNQALDEKHHHEMHELMERQQREREAGDAEFRAFHDKLSPQQQQALDRRLRQHGMHDGCDPQKPSATNKK